MNKRLIHNKVRGMYLVVFLTQAPSKILFTAFNETLAGKMLKMLVCDKIVFHVAFSG